MTPGVFLRIIDGKVVLWDYRQHRQYEIDDQHLKRIVELSAGADFDDGDVDTTIRQAGIFEHAESDAWGWDCISRIFHQGTQITGHQQQQAEAQNNALNYIQYCVSLKDQIPDPHVERDGEVVPLPAPRHDSGAGMPLLQALQERYTCRSFDASTVSLHEVASALWNTFGAIHGTDRTDLEEEGIRSAGYRRTSPSGGSLHPSQAYLLALRVEGLQPGIYHYRSHKHELSVVKPIFDIKTLGRLLCGQHFAEGLSYGIFVTSRFDKMWWKYPHSRAYRVALIDIGCLAQTFQLVSTSQGLASWLTGYFLDAEVNHALDVNEDNESVLFFMGAGMGKGSIAPEDLTSIRQLQAASGQ
jgi:SagB-type dehydrogenase family enzyme